MENLIIKIYKCKKCKVKFFSEYDNSKCHSCGNREHTVLKKASAMYHLSNGVSKLYKEEKSYNILSAIGDLERGIFILK